MMPDLVPMDVGNMSDEEKAALAAAMHQSLHHVLKVRHPECVPPYTLIGLSLKHNSPKETRRILSQHKIRPDQATRFMALYQADWRIYHSDILTPEGEPPRFHEVDGAPAKD